MVNLSGPVKVKRLRLFIPMSWALRSNEKAEWRPQILSGLILRLNSPSSIRDLNQFDEEEGGD